MRRPCPNPDCPLRQAPAFHPDAKGYPRFNQRGALRNMWVHHWVVWRLGGAEFRPERLRERGLEIHHMDFGKDPCPHNLLILPREIHLTFANRTNQKDRAPRKHWPNKEIDSLVVEMIISDRDKRVAYANLSRAELSQLKQLEP